MDNQQGLELAKKIIYALENNDENGFVFHVDIRLRPHGSEGRLVPSLNFLEDYYLNYGREWERYAWIKHRVIVGDEDKISNLITPFVYRKYLDYKTISEIRNLKKLTDLNILKATRIDEDFFRYELNTGHHHHHFRCTKCGNIESIHDCVVEGFIKSLENKGYSKIEHHLEFTGLCPKCCA